MTILVSLLALLLATGVPAISAPAVSAPASPAPAVAEGLRWRQLGPFRAGWATCATGVAGNHRTFYFGGAGGGVWKTTDAGTTWRPQMQNESAAAVGAMAIAPSDPHVLYAGTGQETARYDAMPGDGVFRSDDGGETWRHVGLERTRMIGAIVVDPAEPNRVLVAALGHAFGPNPERGVYRTTDGGGSWRPVLQLGDSVGAVDLACDPSAPRVIYAAMWQMRMHPWLDYFQPQAGPGSGIWRSTDAGAHWTRLVTGLPAGDLGRIGLAAARGQGGRIVYASIASGESRRSRDSTATGRSGLYRTDDGGNHWRLVNPDPSLASSYFGRVTVAPDDAERVYVMGQSIRRSLDGGRHFEVLRGSPGGDDYHFLWIDPIDPTAMIAASDQGAVVSLNGGATWSSWYNQPTGQFYHLAADDRFPYHVYSGQQDNGTVEIASRGPYGVIEERDWHPVGGDEREYMVPKPGDPAVVFGSGLGGSVTRFDAVTRQTADVSPSPEDHYGERPTAVRDRYGWIVPLAISPLPPHPMYLGAQKLFRSIDDGDHWSVVSPDLSGALPGAGPCENPTLDAARACGFGVISTIAPSPRVAARIWVGTDDGKIRLTVDGGRTWRDVTPPDVPPWGLVQTIDASPHDANVAYAAVDLHRIDRHEPLLLRTTDSGHDWQVITRGIPTDEFTSVVRADPVRAGLLYAGTDRAVYVSSDDGGSWRRLASGLPTTWMRDLLPHGDDLVVATQGRGIWVLDDLEPVREGETDTGHESLHLFQPLPAVRLRASENRDTPLPPETPLGDNPPTGAIIDYRLPAPARDPVTLTITGPSGVLVRRFSSADPPESLAAETYFDRRWVAPASALSAEPGMHRFVWDLRHPRPPAPRYHYSISAVWRDGTPVEPMGPFVVPGRYQVTLAVGATRLSRTLEVRPDPRLHVGAGALDQQLALAQAIDSTLARTVSAHAEVARARTASAKTLAAATIDSLAAIADGDGTGLASLAGALATLVTAVQSADAAPTQGQRDLHRECMARLDGLLERWRRIRSGLAAGDGPGH
ncbi:MAG: WD40/YVTN/BNR-like repeat-containing protein [Candidatus Eisenbacteria bacterium]